MEEEAAMKEPQRIAEVQYSKDHDRIELIVPHGTKTAELGRILEALGKDVLSRLPRGCPQCTSGDHLFIRERLEHVIRVDLDRGAIV
jgi:hypothetical protein